MSRRKKITLALVAVIVITWFQGWAFIWTRRRAHSPVCVPVAPFIVYSHDTNNDGPSEGAFYFTYLFGGTQIGRLWLSWRCG